MSGEAQSQRRPIFTLIAWFSLAAPLVAAALILIDSGRSGPHRDPTVPAVDVLLCAAGFVCGCVSLFGIRTNGALAILLPAVPGILLSAAAGLVALIFLGLSGLPQSP